MQADRSILDAVYDDLKPNRFIAFWQCTDELLAYDGICSIEPGYDDLLLSRNPQLAPIVERRDLLLDGWRSSRIHQRKVVDGFVVGHGVDLTSPACERASQRRR